LTYRSAVIVTHSDDGDLTRRGQRNAVADDRRHDKTLCTQRQELIRRWDSERELFNDDIVYVQASAYARWTDFL